MTSGLLSVSKDVTAKALRTRPGAQPGFKYWRLLPFTTLASREHIGIMRMDTWRIN